MKDEDEAKVHFFDVAGIGRKETPSTSLPFQITSLILTAAHADRHDGVVPFASASRERELPPERQWHCDHADMVGHDLNGPSPQTRPAFDYLGAYDSLVRDLIAPRDLIR